MAGSSDNFSSILSYALEQLVTPNLSVHVVTDRICLEHFLPSSLTRDRVQEKGTW